jgi:hypothetical protein
MSQENVEIVRNVIEAFQAGWERGNATAFDWTAHIARDAEWIPTRARRACGLPGR